MSQNLSETQFHSVRKLYATQQLQTLADLLWSLVLLGSWFNVDQLEIRQRSILSLLLLLLLLSFFITFSLYCFITICDSDDFWPHCLKM